jgi:hypothetical protein
MMMLYWTKLQERKLDELKMKAALAGVDPRTLDDPEDKREEVEAQIADPLKGFPNDIDYLDEKSCNVKVQLSERSKSLSIEKRWDEYRKRCCLGKLGPAAKRCSMNDVLWMRYAESVAKNAPFTLEQVRANIEFDVARKELYPPDYKGTGAEPPPQDHINRLQSEGRYLEIIQKLDEISRRM